ncbi:MAG: hypothetical protein KDA33_11075 [Phycisphaerales bacterium]|nr:hypothetical protein [Phycisphaerales bacterium]
MMIRFSGRAGAISFLGLLWFVAASAGCIDQREVADIGEIYRSAARDDSPQRRPVIVIPGILGSRLAQRGTGRVVWGGFGGGYADPSTPDGARLFAMPMGEGMALAGLRDDVVADGALDRVRLSVFGLPLELNAYFNLLVTLGVGGYRDQQLAAAGAVDYGEAHFTCFQFAYDWRRSNVENAALLKAFIEEKREYIRGQLRKKHGRDCDDVKFGIVAHSMGGLLTRYFLRYGDAPLPESGDLPDLTWAGAQYVDKAILVGTPNAGSVSALDQLVHGARPAPIIEPYPAALVGTIPAIHELLPRGRHGTLIIDDDEGRVVDDLSDIDVWREYGWGPFDPRQSRSLATLLPDAGDDEVRRRVAIDHLDKCLTNARRFHAALDRPATPPADLELCLYAGDAIATPAVLSVNSRDGSLTTHATAAGDGTVPRYSALMDERRGGAYRPTLQSPVTWRHITFLFEDHLGLTKSPTFSDNILMELLEL